MKKATLLLISMLLVLSVGADELDLKLDNLSGNYYDKSTHTITFPSNSWKELQWWLATWNSETSKNEGTDYSSYDEFVLEYETSATEEFRIYFNFGNGTKNHTVYPKSDPETGQTVVKLNEEGKSSVMKAVLSSTGNTNEFTMVLKRAYFRTSGETAIQPVHTKTKDDSACYTIQGIKVSKPTKGLYIKNGRKVIVK